MAAGAWGCREKAEASKRVEHLVVRWIVVRPEDLMHNMATIVDVVLINWNFLRVEPKCSHSPLLPKKVNMWW